MAGTSSFSDPGYPLIQSDYINTIIDMLELSEDGTTLDPKDLRDSNWTLWNKIEDVEISASQSVQYERLDSTLISVGGISVGSTFSGTVVDVIDRLLYPYVSQVNSLTASETVREFGGPLELDLEWNVSLGSNDIEEIIISGEYIIPLVNFGVQTITSTHSLNPGISEVISYTMSSFDGVSNLITSVDFKWLNRVYWGTISLTSLGNPDLYLQVDVIPDVSDYIDGVGILELSNSKLSATMSSTYIIGGVGEYLCFAWPSLFGEPTFIVNGMNNSAFTKVKSEYSFENNYGFSGVDYDVWLSNVGYNSTVEIIIK